MAEQHTTSGNRSQAENSVTAPKLSGEEMFLSAVRSIQLEQAQGGVTQSIVGTSFGPVLATGEDNEPGSYPVFFPPASEDAPSSSGDVPPAQGEELSEEENGVEHVGPVVHPNFRGLMMGSPFGPPLGQLVGNDNKFNQLHAARPPGINSGTIFDAFSATSILANGFEIGGESTGTPGDSDGPDGTNLAPDGLPAAYASADGYSATSYANSENYQNNNEGGSA